MKSANELRTLLRSIDHKSYPAYKSLAGSYQFPGFRKFDSLPPSSTQMQFHFIPYFSWFSSFLFCQIFEIFL